MVRIETPSFTPRLYYADLMSRNSLLRRRARAVLLGLVVLLYVVSVPWYREAGATPSIVFGLPDWVAVALGCYVGVAILNSLAWLLTDLQDRDEEAP